MQAPTHVLTGVIIEQLCRRTQPPWVKAVILCGSALLSHSILDRLARLTYHPPEPDFSSFFWVSYHLGVLAALIVFLRWFWKAYRYGIIFSVLPDLDWVIKHGYSVLGISPDFYNRPYLHTLIHWVSDHIPVLNHLQYLPDYTAYRQGALLEASLVVILLGIACRMHLWRHFREV
ncbi:MAG: hypothetical protein KatS3mg031_0763 [Chitinophagales bacterium]|nr:MAG: hypothetical protein KatS3mg031_0763 [Chitinophagales bacterium]